MSKLTPNDVLHVAKLAKLTLKEDHIAKFQEQLSEVISYIDELKEVDTSNIEPTSQTTNLLNVVREDEIQTDRILPQNAAVSGTEKIHNNFFIVPAVLNRDDH